MEKIINITTAGRVIAIYDTAYTALKNYLDTLHIYFAQEEGRDEIISDMESRISELMSDEIRRGSPAITDAHIEAIIAGMGRVEDFAQADAGGETTGPGSLASAGPGRVGHRRLQRNSDDQIVGGVCSGIAAYFNVDPALIRIVFGILTLGGWGTGILLYVVLWVVVPEASLKTYNGRRLFRLQEDKWIGGVCAGLGAYFDKDPLLFRGMFVVPFIITGIFSWSFLPFDGSFVLGSLSGTFVLIYILLWIVLPYAATGFDRMQMRGEKIDLDSIRRNVQSGTSAAKDRMQSWSAEVRKTATRLSAGVAADARPMASGAASALGRIIRAIFLFIGWTVAFSLFAALIAYIFGGGASLANRFLLLSDGQRTLGWASVALFFGIPLLGLMTMLVRRSLRIRGGRKYISAGFALLWAAGFVCMLALAASVGRDFNRIADIPAEVPIAQPSRGKLVLAVPAAQIEYSQTLPWLHGDITGWDVVGDTMRSALVEVQATLSGDSFFHVMIHRRSNGITPDKARERAMHLEYTPVIVAGTDSILALPGGYNISAADGWRAQEIEVEVQVPAGKIIRLDRSVSEKLAGSGFRHRRHFRAGNKTWSIVEYNSSATGYMEEDTDYRMEGNGELIAIAGKGLEDQKSERLAIGREAREDALNDSLDHAADAASVARDQRIDSLDRAADAAALARDRHIDSLDRAMDALKRQREWLQADRD